MITGPDGQPLELRGVSFIERFDEDSRSVCMWRALVVTTDSRGPRFTERGWMIAETASDALSSSPDDAHCVVRTCYQVACDTKGDQSACGQDGITNRLIETVLRTLGSNTRTYFQFQQNELLAEFARSSSSTHAPSFRLLA